MGAEGEPLAAVLDDATSTMLLELTTGRTRTAVGYERFARLSEMYVTHMISQGLTKILPPQDSLESFKGWCNWMHVGYRVGVKAISYRPFLILYYTQAKQSTPPWT